MEEDIQRKIREIINEIERKSANANYIYRGEPKTHDEHPHYGKVSSSLWREYGIEGDDFDIEIIQREMVNGAKKHIGDLPQDFRIDLKSSLNLSQEESDKTTDFEILAEIQHYGGKTNLIDFTTDYLIALFFACDGHHEKDGRVILQRTEDIQDRIYRPRNPRHRVIAQKSVFVRPLTGFIEPHEDDIVTIPRELKRWILQNLRKHHDAISKVTIYNDLHGFIKHQDIHGDAYTQFYRAFACQERGDEATTSKEKQEEYEKSIEHFTQAIKLEPSFFEAYHNRSNAYGELEKWCLAIKDLNEAIRLHPNFAEAYYNRGMIYRDIDEVDSAIADYSKAIALNPNYVEAHNNRGITYEKKGDYKRAIADYSKAIALNPNFADAYYNRGAAYYRTGDYEHAIIDYTKTIELDPDHAANAATYYNRGEARLHLSKWEEAKADLTTAKEKGENIVNHFQKEYESVADFKERNGIQLPANIVEMLTPTHS